MSIAPSFLPTCKVCDGGELVPEKVFRMSTPVVVIGFILLIPPVLGMAAATLMSFRATAGDTIAAKSRREPTTFSDSAPAESQSDIDFRNACAQGATKGGNLSEKTAGLCTASWEHGDFAMPSASEQAPYVRVYNSHTDPWGYQQAQSRAEESKSESNSGITPLQVLGGSVAIEIGVVSFVSGLLGWLLIMKKRVLKCAMCRATVSAS